MAKHIFWGMILLLSGCVSVQDTELIGRNDPRAVQVYRQYLRRNPKSADLKNKLGYAYLRANQTDNAIGQFESVLAKDPKNPHAVLYLGVAYLYKDDPDKTLKLWEEYKNQDKPRIEAEMQRIMTVIRIVKSHQTARDAVMQESSQTRAMVNPNSVAVCYYDDITGNRSMLAYRKALPAMIITYLSKIKSLTVIERIYLQALLEEMNFGRTGIVDQATAPKVGKLLGAENLVTGNLSHGSICATTSVVSASQSDIRTSMVHWTDPENFFKLPILIVRDIVNSMNIELSDEEKQSLSVPQTTNYKAFVYYGQALHALDAGNWKMARDLFEKALTQDPDFELARRGRDSCPDDIYFPGIEELRVMKYRRLARLTEPIVERLLSEQTRAVEYVQKDKGKGDDKSSSINQYRDLEIQELMDDYKERNRNSDVQFTWP